jgi:hypothetical protein
MWIESVQPFSCRERSPALAAKLGKAVGIGHRLRRSLSFARRVQSVVVASALIALLPGCASRPTGVLSPVADSSPSTSRVEMLVATTRGRASTSGEMFSGERGLAPAFAEITVSIPPDNVRKIGEVAWPRKLPSDPSTDFATLKADELSREGAEGWLKRSVSKSSDRSVLVFVHGFNNRFEDSVYRFAQIVHDSGANSVPVLVTWPSRGSLLAYGYDRESTNYTRNALENLFQYLARDPDVKEVSVLAHSMGNWLALESLRQMAIRNDGLPAKFKNVCLPPQTSMYRRSPIWERRAHNSHFSSHAMTVLWRCRGASGAMLHDWARSIQNRSHTDPNSRLTTYPSSILRRSKRAMISITANSQSRRRSSNSSAPACRADRP